MKSICIATDLHADADRALSRAVRLAHQHGARLSVVSVLPAGAQNIEITSRRDTLAALLGQLPHAHNLQTEITVATGDAVEEVHRTASDVGADLLVVGPHHHSGPLDALRLTTVEKLARSAEIPVLLVSRPMDRDYGVILAPVDFSDACAAAVRAAGKLAPGAKIHLLHAVGVPHQAIVAAPGAVGDLTTMVDPAPFIADARTRATEWLAAQPGLSGLAPPEPANAVLPSVLETARQTYGCDLICLGAHTKRGLLDRMLGSFTSELVRDPLSDLLIATKKAPV